MIMAVSRCFGCVLLCSVLRPSEIHRVMKQPSLIQRFKKEYNSWVHARYRCHNRKAPDWARYGGKGITVCDEWRNNFKAFLDHVGPAPSPAHSIDRINNGKGYEPGNVRWATAKEQAQNRKQAVNYAKRGT